MSARPTQRDLVLAALKEAGSYGLHTFQLRGEPLWIGNPSQRISELEDLGYEIEHSREKLHGRAQGTRYVLKSAGGQGAVSSPAPVRDHNPPRREVTEPSADQEPAPLVGFDAAIEVGGPTVTRKPSAYDPFSEAA